MDISTMLDIIDFFNSQTERKQQVDAAKTELRAQKQDILDQQQEADTVAIDMQQLLNTLLRNRDCRYSADCRAAIKEIQQAMIEGRSASLEALSWAHYIDHKINTLSGDLSIMLDGNEAYLRLRS